MLTEDWPELEVLRLRYIAQVLEKNRGNKTRAADMLGIGDSDSNRLPVAKHQPAPCAP